MWLNFDAAMCDLCSEAETHLLLAGVERQIILAEADEGDSIAAASRPLSGKERAAKIRFGDLDKSEQTAAGRAATILRTLRKKIGATIMGALLSDNDTVAPETAVAKLAAMSTNQPKPASVAISAAVAALQGILAGSYTDASRIAVAEAMRQGLTAAPKPLSVEAGRFAAQATLAPAYLWRRTTGKLEDVLLAPQRISGPPLTRAAVLDQLEDIPVDGAVDLARQSIHAAQGTGRADTAELIGPEDIFSSEILDTATCGPCATADGRDYDSLADARAEYPGGYVRCDGGGRCRGTLAFIYR